MSEPERSKERGTGFAAPAARRSQAVWMVVPALLIVWLVALLSSATFGGWAHLLPLIAAGLAIWRVAARFRGRHLTESARKH